MLVRHRFELLEINRNQIYSITFVWITAGDQRNVKCLVSAVSTKLDKQLYEVGKVLSILRINRKTASVQFAVIQTIFIKARTINYYRQK